MPQASPTYPTGNIPLFIAFRVLFNVRFYYPVLGILFLDLGISLEQYSILNAVWAATIIVLEIPSGALADLIGRRRMVVTAGVLMVCEMLIFAFSPAGPWLFWLLALNRVLSGAAEACASGADEALAYDSLDPANREATWPDVLARLVRWSSGSFFIAMIVGAAVFDAGLLNRIAGWLGFVPGLLQTQTLRWPVFLTLATAVPALVCALLMREPPGRPPMQQAPIAGAIRNIFSAARFVFTSRRILLLLLVAVLFDSTVRIFLTFASNYYRLIGLPEFTNGILGSAYALLGFVAAFFARKLTGRMPVWAVFILVGGILFAGLCGLAVATPVWGVWVLLPIGLAMPMLYYFLSNFLNEWTDSSIRATVLSFRGMAMNLGYGFAGISFAAVTAGIRASSPGLTQNELFHRSLLSLPAAFAVGAVLVAAFARTTSSKAPEGS